MYGLIHFWLGGGGGDVKPPDMPWELVLSLDTLLSALAYWRTVGLVLGCVVVLWLVGRRLVRRVL